MKFEDILTAHGIKYVNGNGKNEIKLCCLFCTDRNETADNRFRLGINTYTKQASCFNCGWSSKNNAINLVLRKIRVKDIVEVKEDIEKKIEEVVTLPIGFEYLDPDKDSKYWYHKNALSYLKERQIPNWQITAKKMGVTISDKFSYRIIFPVVYRKELVGIVGRDFTGSSKLKYLNSTGDKYLYNYPSNRRDVQEIVLSEGIFKCLKIERVAKLTSISLLGHTLTELHIKQLDKLKKLESIIIWPDTDKIGIKSVIKICDKLKELNYDVYTILPVPIKQADELSDKEVKHLLHTKVKYSELVANKLRTKAAFL
jgi:DNA primase-like protein/Toprim domain-containing protein